jgi:short-subunit dehydrogenase
MKSSDSPRTALVTGGSSGIGYAIACELARLKYNLVLVSNQDNQLKDACDFIASEYEVNVNSFFIDLTDEDAAPKLFEWCCKKEIKVDVLINNAGIFFFGEVVESDIDKTKGMISLHTTAPVLLCTLFGKEMKKRRSGNIVIISSITAYMPYPGIALYSATKRFLKSFSRSLRTEMLDYNVNVTCVCPAAVATGLYNLSESLQKRLLKTGIIMRPEKIARIIVRAMHRKRAMIIPGLINRMFLAALLIVPQSIIVLIRRYSRFLPPDK